MSAKAQKPLPKKPHGHATNGTRMMRVPDEFYVAVHTAAEDASVRASDIMRDLVGFLATRDAIHA